MSKQIPSIETQDIDHLGIVAGIVDEIGIVERIDASKFSRLIDV